jgi:hypothetical protein
MKVRNPLPDKVYSLYYDSEKIISPCCCILLGGGKYGVANSEEPECENLGVGTILFATDVISCSSPSSALA